MNGELLLQASEIPSGCPLADLDVIEVGGETLVVCADWVGDVWTWAPARDAWRKQPLARALDEEWLAEYPDAAHEIDTVAVAVFDGRVILAAGGDEYGSAAWDLTSGAVLRRTSMEAPYLGAAETLAADGTGAPQFVTGTQYEGAVHVWGPTDEEPLLSLCDDQTDIRDLATARVDGQALIAAGGSGVDVWTLNDEGPLASFSPEDGEVRAVGLARCDGRTLVTGVADAEEGAELYVWELPEGVGEQENDEPIQDPSTGHDGRVFTMDTITIGDRPLAVTGSDDETVRVWDVVGGAAVGRPLLEHKGGIEVVRTTLLRGRHVALSAGRDGWIRVWDLAALPR